MLDYSPILLVGAMAVSPDLLPITAAGVAVVSRNGRLLARALLTLAAGMATAGLAATASTALQRALDVMPPNFQIDNTILNSLDTVGYETVTVAFFAGMLALETRESSGVGVAISVTTIPAAAYYGNRGGDGRGARRARRTRRARRERRDAHRGRVAHPHRPAHAAWIARAS